MAASIDSEVARATIREAELAEELRSPGDGLDFTTLIGFEDGRVALAQRTDGLDFVPSSALIARFRIPETDPLLRAKVQIASVNGQSHSTGGPWDAVMARAYAMTFQGDGLLQLTGMRRGDGATAEDTASPSLYGYDHAYPAICKLWAYFPPR
ncbi:MAG: hypothetical protein QM682_16925 [Paracoccus sp. (in: a-proteobacteria)]|uniref:hypothetical protein n=1 Tax=Paracoccus sp. TaxID=267 RepID=UPI0039E58CC8